MAKEKKNGSMVLNLKAITNVAKNMDKVTFNGLMDPVTSAHSTRIIYKVPVSIPGQMVECMMVNGSIIKCMVVASSRIPMVVDTKAITKTIGRMAVA